VARRLRPGIGSASSATRPAWWSTSPSLPGDGPAGKLTDIQRSRLLLGAVTAIDELGYAHATVAQITSRARVSRRTFYELFPNREVCVAAVLDNTAARLERDLQACALDGLPWRERLRGGLWAVLCFLEREPALARVCVVHALRGSGVVLERREAILARLIAAVDEGRREAPGAIGCSRLTAEGVVGAALAILYARLSLEQREPLTDLLGELMGMIVLPYQGPAAARREQARSAPALPEQEPRSSAQAALSVADPLAGLRMRLTYRTARVLEGIGENPGASNREVARHAGIHDQGQISKLLARLERLGLLTNQGDGHAKGEPNAWCLTARGWRVIQGIGAHASHRSEAA
jgi:AcrR family transcriptional regulator